VGVKYSWGNLVTQIQRNREKVKRRGQEINKLYRDSEMYEEAKGTMKSKI
jgi:hypothetical protein